MEAKIIRHSADDISYEYYLGKNWKQEYKPPAKEGIVPTVISNHVSYWDIPAMGAVLKGDGCFAAASYIKNVPFLGPVCTALGSVYIPRAATKEKLAKTLDGLTKRTKINEEKGTFPPTIIFPEGTTSNNICLMKFRRGAFYAMRQI